MVLLDTGTPGTSREIFDPKISDGHPRMFNIRVRMLPPLGFEWTFSGDLS